MLRSEGEKKDGDLVRKHKPVVVGGGHAQVSWLSLG